MGRRWWGVVLGSVAFHALLALLFVLDLMGKPVPATPPAMVVTLERAPAPPKAAPALRRVARTPSAKPRPAAAPAAPAAPVTGPVVPAAPASPPSPQAAVVAKPSMPDLRGLGGCRLATLDRLPADARARCQEQLAETGGEGPAPRPNLDPTGRYVRDARPYLTRPPVNGCKPVGSVTKLPNGQTSVTLSGGCGKSF